MRLIQTFTLLTIATFFTASCFGQVADPFGGGSDPFGSNTQPKKAPKRDVGNNPFGNGGAETQPANPVPPINQEQKVRAPMKRKSFMKSERVGATETGARIIASLDDETSQTFVDTPLQEAIQVISDTHNIPIVIDRRALEEIGLSPDLPVSLMLKNVSLRSFLRLMLREFDLTYIVKDEVMQITTVEAADQLLSIRMHALPDQFTSKLPELVKVIQSTVEPNAWEALGGPSTMASLDHILIVNAHTNLQEKVEAFLEHLIGMYE